LLDNETATALMNNPEAKRGFLDIAMKHVFDILCSLFPDEPPDALHAMMLAKMEERIREAANAGQ
jgi:hypothetical protein